MSETAAGLIRNFLMASLAYTGKEDDDVDEEMPDVKKTFDSPQIPLSVQRVHNIIDSMNTTKKDDNGDENMYRVSETLVKSVSLGASMWHLKSHESSVAVDRSYVSAATVSGGADAEASRKGASRRRPKAELLAKTMPARFAAWKTKLDNSDKPPAIEQWRVLNGIYAI